MRRLRPSLLGLLTPAASPGRRGWIHYFLSLDAYVDGRLESACEHASLSAEKGQEINHEVMVASAVGAHLLAASALDEAIDLATLTEGLELMRRPSVQALSAFGLWLVAKVCGRGCTKQRRTVARRTPSEPSRHSIPSCGPRTSCVTRRSPFSESTTSTACVTGSSRWIMPPRWPRRSLGSADESRVSARGVGDGCSAVGQREFGDSTARYSLPGRRPVHIGPSTRAAPGLGRRPPVADAHRAADAPGVSGSSQTRPPP